jgi:hypothetical protein
LLFNFALEYTIRKDQENQMGLKLNGTHQLLFYVDDVNPVADNINTMKKNKDVAYGTSKEAGLEVNTEKTKNVLTSHDQNGGQNHNFR